MSQIYAHRGFSGKYPENTMLAFEKAVEMGCDGIETDVQMTSDGELVLIHDEWLERTTNGAGWVHQHTLAELKALDANKLFAGTYPAQQMPTLREYFEYMQDKPLITNLELKTGLDVYPGIEKAVIDMAREYNMLDKISISSFNHYTIVRCRELAPQVNYGLLVNCWIVDVGAYAKKLGANTVNAEFRACLHREVVDEMHRNGIGAVVYTPNEVEDMKKLVENGVDILISNFPDRGMKVLGRA